MSTETGIERLRAAVRLFGDCREDFLSRFTVQELLKIHAAWRASDWEILPDRWSATQVRQALCGIAPDFDDNEEPIPSKKRVPSDGRKRDV